ncbi:MAG: cupin domain-containing protein [Chromatiales bacterium]|jgi:quercetin dioxygenase-like cupin family protein|nr:cupin domain-containing protein [Chromatiales bacterium]
MSRIVRHPGGVLPPDVAARWAGAGLAELTHAPTGYSGLGLELVELAPGESGVARRGSSEESLLVVLAGSVTVEEVAGAGETISAAAGDAVAIGAGVSHRLRNDSGSVPARCVLYAGGVNPVPVSG